MRSDEQMGQNDMELKDHGSVSSTINAAAAHVRQLHPASACDHLLLSCQATVGTKLPYLDPAILSG